MCSTQQCRFVGVCQSCVDQLGLELSEFTIGIIAESCWLCGKPVDQVNLCVVEATESLNSKKIERAIAAWLKSIDDGSASVVAIPQNTKALVFTYPPGLGDKIAQVAETLSQFSREAGINLPVLLLPNEFGLIQITEQEIADQLDTLENLVSLRADNPNPEG